MVLTVDVGNSNTIFGGFEGDALAFAARMATNTVRTEDEYAGFIINMLTLHRIERADIDGAIISSVVPTVDGIVKRALERTFGIAPLTVGPGIKTGIRIHCDSPSSVGADLIAACVAAEATYGSPALIVDMGTATKMTLLSGGAFEGVSILPGVLMGLNSLAEQTAQLPKVSPEAPSRVIGKNTVDCIKSGVVFGHAAMIDGMIDRIEREVGAPLPVIATGGLSDLVIPYCTHDIHTDCDLVLRGLNLLYKKNK